MSRAEATPPAPARRVSRPDFLAGIGYYRLTWTEEGLQAVVNSIRDREGDTTARVRFLALTPNGGAPKHIYRTRLNFESDYTKSHLANTLTAAQPTFCKAEWTQIIEQIAVNVTDAVQRREREEELWTFDEAQAPRYLLDPLLPENEPTIIFGHGASGKSYLALAAAVCVQLPWTDNPLGLRTQETSKTVLWLDWETRRDTVLWRLKRLQRGMGLPDISLIYRRCSLPLADDVEEVQRIVSEKGVKLIVVDSLFGAIGAELKDVGPAARLFTAARSLPVTWLFITHIRKGGDDDGAREGTPYGSVFFTNEARSVWEVKRAQSYGADRIEIGLFHRKVNETGLNRPLGFTIDYSEGKTRIERTDVREMETLSQNLPLSDRILYALRRQKMNVVELAEELSHERKPVAEACSRLKRSGKLTYSEATGKYGAQEHAQDKPQI